MEEQKWKRAKDWNDGLHYLNAPSHGYTTMVLIKSHIDTIVKCANDDPLLFAHDLKDELPRIAGLIIDVKKWVNAVLDAPAGVIPPNGAKTCN